MGEAQSDLQDGVDWKGETGAPRPSHPSKTGCPGESREKLMNRAKRGLSEPHPRMYLPASAVDPSAACATPMAARTQTLPSQPGSCWIPGVSPTQELMHSRHFVTAATGSQGCRGGKWAAFGAVFLLLLGGSGASLHPLLALRWNTERSPPPDLSCSLLHT